MQEKQPTPESKPVKKPDDMSGVLTQAKLKIYDPETKEVFVEQRA